MVRKELKIFDSRHSSLIISILLFFFTTVFSLFPLTCSGNVVLRTEPTLIEKVFNSPTICFILLFFIYFLINFIVLAVVYFILRLGHLVKSLRFLRYTFFAAFGGFLVNVIIIYLGGLIIEAIVAKGGALDKFSSILTPAISFILVFLILLFYNYWLARKVFSLTKRQAFIVGTAMGIFSNSASLFCSSKLLGILLAPFEFHGGLY